MEIRDDDQFFLLALLECDRTLGADHGIQTSNAYRPRCGRRLAAVGLASECVVIVPSRYGEPASCRGYTITSLGRELAASLSQRPLKRWVGGRSDSNLSAVIAHPRNHPLYRTWKDMKRRCYSSSREEARNYKDRGIRVCDSWRASFAAFVADVGERPSPEHSIDRIDNDGHYEPGNVRWATRTEQNLNRRVNRFLTVNGVTKSFSQWAKEIGVANRTIADRVAKGLSPEEVVQTALPQSKVRRAG